MSGTGPRLTPYHWWGDAWARPNPRTLQELVDLGMVAQPDADILVAHVQSGGSVIVGSSSSGCGKSTLANALREFTPEQRTPVFVRGNHEMFAWIADYSPSSLTLLVNEISEYLPVYAWDEATNRILQLTGSGAQLITTMHVSSHPELTSRLTSPPIAASPYEINSLGLLVVLDEPRTLNCGLATVREIVDLQTGRPKRTA